MRVLGYGSCHTNNQSAAAVQSRSAADTIMRGHSKFSHKFSAERRDPITPVGFYLQTLTFLHSKTTEGTEIRSQLQGIVFGQEQVGDRLCLNCYDRACPAVI